MTLHRVVDQSYFDGYLVGCAERSDAHQSRTMRLQSRHILWRFRQSVDIRLGLPALI